jgi:RNA polymerase sigma-70 factor (ECF subfamily)
VDRALVEQAQHGNREAFELLAVQISDALYLVASRILGDSEAAGDALQVSLVTIWRDLPTLRDADRFEAWAYRVVVNRCYQHLRSVRRGPILLRIAPADASVPDVQLAVGARDELERAFERLSAEHRTVVVLHYFRDLSVSEIAAWLGISPGTVKSRLHHARETLRSAIDADARTPRREGRTA